ncbi:carbohydrate esterase family 16 protein [Exidia glandulosa HHB12029]|uniref:Carbohydrate esterase family 16 protein n=1 Tax=Exidia glandulosa HHB12029 TaxID=1314781 RepID=A0A165F0U6_EXIGL|nr:carbohydrate esterase family 16 protein [Exidia glandulosa HHB12029]
MRSVLVACALTSQLVAARFFWPDITHIFSFGDSYTDTIARFDFTTHALSAPNDAATTAGGRMWIEFLAQTYNVTADLKVFNFAYGGAVTDSSLIAQSSSATQSFKDQVNNFLLLQSTPAAQGWKSSNALFLSFFGINDVGKSFWWTNATREETNARVIASYFERLTILRDAGARNFLLLQVPDISRTPNLIRQGAPNATLQSSMSENYNTQLARAVQVFQRHSTRVGKVVDVKIHPTRELFNFALDNAGVLGFENVTAGWWTGLAPEQQSGVSLATYFWWNNFHPTWGVHDLLGHSVSTFLSRWSGL